MNRNRAFTQQELDEMATQTSEAAMQAIESGDKEQAMKFIGRMRHEYQGMIDMYMNWVADLMDYIYVHDGEEAFHEAMRKALDMSQAIKVYDKADFRSRVKMLASSLKGLLQPLEIEEDDEKVTIKMNPCGSGQRLLESGAYDPPRNLSLMKPSRLTWGLPDFPIYCAHTPVQEIDCIEKIGYPLFVKYPAKEMAKDSCRFCIYKYPKSIPEEVYTRLGLTKPKEMR